MAVQNAGTGLERRMDWYRDARFGLFIHWGAYAAAGAEASWPVMAPGLSEAMFGTPSVIKEAEYVSLPARFDPVAFDADAWVRIAKDAGMRYIVITSKHHAGAVHPQGRGPGPDGRAAIGRRPGERALLQASGRPVQGARRPRLDTEADAAVLRRLPGAQIGRAQV